MRQDAGTPVLSRMNGEELAWVAVAACFFACGPGPASGNDAGNGAPDGSTGSGTDAGPGDAGSTGNACPTPGTGEARLPACTAAATSTVNVPAGCVPTVDGTLHFEEWADAACISLGASGDVAYLKYAAGNVYLAFSATPACGCGMSFAFGPADSATFDGTQFAVNVFDDPFSTNGDRGDFVIQNGGWTQGSAPAGIVTACPGNQPNPINYEFKIPFAALRIQAGSAHTFGFAIDHPSGGVWPAGLALTAGSSLPGDPSTWGSVSSSANWQ